MSKATNKNRLPPFVPLLINTLDSAAWRAMSPGARSLYVSLKRRIWKGRNTAFLSYRQAAVELGCSKTRVGRWYRELEHYGFIVLAKHGCLGVDGKGKAPLWRLTELGATSKASANGLLEPPTNDFLKWDGTPFKPDSKNRIPSTRGGQCVHPSGTVLSTHRVHPKCEVATRGGHSNASKCPPVGDITKLATVAATDPALDPASTDTSDDTYPELPACLRRVK